MEGKLPAVMVSSTFYDLRQIRMDLMHFIENELGYRALVSEHASFPVDPDVDTIENCRKRVEHDADMLILIIGGRYGSIESKSNKSVTNLEYASARAKGIPIYAFIEKSILTLGAVWQSNPNADFSKQVDNPKLFEFVQRVRTEDRVWTNPFEYAQDIVKVLRPQFAYLMRAGLDRTLIQKRRQLPPTMDALSSEAYRFALEQPEAWEYFFFAQVLLDEIEKQRHLRHDQRAGRALHHTEYVDDIHNWLAARFEELNKLVMAASSLVNDDFKVAMRPPGSEANVIDLMIVAQKLGEIYRLTLEWSLCARGIVGVKKRHRKIATELSKCAEGFISRLEHFGEEILIKVDAAIQSAVGSPARKIEVVFSIAMSNEVALCRAIEESRLISDEEDED